MSAPKAVAVGQRVDLTFKHNRIHGRHGWLRLTPAYSVRMVEQVLAEFGGSASSVLDPFSGTGTTALCAAYRGLRAVATDINPFLIWFARGKSAQYSAAQRVAFEAAAHCLTRRLREGTARPAAIPALRNIERWWHPEALAFVAALRGEVERVEAEPIRDLLKITFCRTLMSLSNAAFDHQSMSFNASSSAEASARKAEPDLEEFVTRFADDVSTVALGIMENPAGPVHIEQVDSRALGELRLPPGSFDLLITSPPYPNRMSYIRELRPYMYWLGFLDESKAAGALDWQAIGGTWGSATSRLGTWKPSGAFIPEYLFPILQQIRDGHPKYGRVMAQYVLKYFDDMSVHFNSAAQLLRHQGTAHYIVGNSTFYGHLVPAERLYVDQLLRAGFRSAEVRALRRRSSKKELVEFHVIAER